MRYSLGQLLGWVTFTSMALGLYGSFPGAAVVAALTMPVYLTWVHWEPEGKGKGWFLVALVAIFGQCAFYAELVRILRLDGGGFEIIRYGFLLMAGFALHGIAAFVLSIGATCHNKRAIWMPLGETLVGIASCWWLLTLD